MSVTFLGVAIGLRRFRDVVMATLLSERRSLASLPVFTDDMLPLRLVTSGDVAGPDHQTYPTRLEWTWQTERGSIAPVSSTVADIRLDQPSSVSR